MKRKTLLISLVALFSAPLYAGEACTWSEALLALEQGNQTRGMALMRMAAGDGDQRAALWLRERQGRNSLAATGDRGENHLGDGHLSGR